MCMHHMDGYLEAGEDGGLQVRDIECRDDHMGQSPVQLGGAEVPTEQLLEVLSIVLGPGHHPQSCADLGED